MPEQMNLMMGVSKERSENITFLVFGMIQQEVHSGALT